MKPFTWIVTSAITAGAFVVTWINFGSASRARSTAADISAKCARLDNEIAATQKRFAETSHHEEELRALLQKAQVRLDKPSVSDAQKPAVPSEVLPVRPDLSVLMEANPELRALFRNSFRASLALFYHPLYVAAKPTPEQIEKFELIMTEAEQDKQDFQSVLKAQGFTANDPAAAKLRQQNEDKLQTAQKEVLGEMGYEQLQRHKRRIPLLVVVSGSAALVAESPTPLTLSQVEQLTDILASTSSAYQKGAIADPTALDWSTALGKAQPILSPAQFEALKTSARLMDLLKLVKEFHAQQKVSGR